MALPAATMAATCAGAPAGATARPSGSAVAPGVGGGGVVAVGTGASGDACACAAVPPGGELVLVYVVPPVGEDACAWAGRTTMSTATASATQRRRDISLVRCSAWLGRPPHLGAAMHEVGPRKLRKGAQTARTACNAACVEQEGRAPGRTAGHAQSPAARSACRVRRGGRLPARLRRDRRRRGPVRGRRARRQPPRGAAVLLPPADRRLHRRAPVDPRAPGVLRAGRARAGRLRRAGRLPRRAGRVPVPRPAPRAGRGGAARLPDPRLRGLRR